MKLIAVYLRLTLVALLWGTTFSISLVLLRTIDVFALIALRMFFGFVALLLYLTFKRKLNEIKPMFHANTRWMFIIGVVFFALAYVVQYVALPLTTTINQAILLNFQAFFVVGINFFYFKQKANYMVIVGAVVAFTGALLINITPDLSFSFTTIWGDLLTIVSCAFWGSFTAFSKPICEPEENDPIVFNTIIMLIAMCTLVPFGVISPTGFARLGSFGAWEWLGVMWLGVACVGVTYMLWFTGLKHIDSSRVVVFVYLEPIFAGILGVLFLSEMITWFSALGMILCFTGVWLAQQVPKRKSGAFSPSTTSINATTAGEKVP
nr:EamA family transporter [Candidatus Sigynarchaeota archaeon]